MTLRWEALQRYSGILVLHSTIWIVIIFLVLRTIFYIFNGSHIFKGHLFTF